MSDNEDIVVSNDNDTFNGESDDEVESVQNNTNITPTKSVQGEIVTEKLGKTSPIYIY